DYENGKAHEQDIEDIGDFIVVNSKFISSDGEVKKYTNTAFCPAQKGDILMVLSDVPNGKAIAKCFLVEENNRYTVNQRIGRIIPQSLNSKILYYLLNRNPYLLAFDDGVKQTNLRKEDVLNCPLLIPKNPKEQQKIASCLSSLDEVIAGERQRLELLKAHKKGLLQNLFPREGETVPKLRFPEFKDSGEWEVTALSELGYLINGLTYSPEDVREKGLLVLRSSNIQDGLIDLKDCVYVRENIKGVNLIKPRDILVCVRNGSKDLIGKNAMIPEGIPLATHGAFMTIFRANNPEFVFQLFQTDYYDKQVRADLGATINSINGKNFIKYKFPVPENPKEQQKIADCLSSLDDVIQAQQQKIELLEQHKKGLLQGLFPNLKQLDNERCNYDI
ncbi:MAG TPA: restriction endonuclease subunit S, partial [Bacteroidales bacterium]|nr:restriction endonuclease subunit S [Bacteroidales bacterium]